MGKEKSFWLECKYFFQKHYIKLFLLILFCIFLYFLGFYPNLKKSNLDGICTSLILSDLSGSYTNCIDSIKEFSNFSLKDRFDSILELIKIVIAIIGFCFIYKQLKTQNEQLEAQSEALKMETLLNALEPFKKEKPIRADIHVGLSMLKSITRKEELKQDKVNYSITMTRFFIEHLEKEDSDWEGYYKQYPRDFYEIGVTVWLAGKKIDSCDKNDALFYCFKGFLITFEKVYKRIYCSNSILSEKGEELYIELWTKLKETTKCIEKKNGYRDDDFCEKKEKIH